jgi:hypothetical protein
VKLETKSLAKALPAHLQGSKMSNDMASKYKQNNMAPASAFNVKDEPGLSMDDEEEEEAVKAEIVLDDNSSGQNHPHNDFDDDEHDNMVQFRAAMWCGSIENICCDLLLVCFCSFKFPGGFFEPTTNYATTYDWLSTFRENMQEIE